jgi:hypothetical protein
VIDRAIVTSIALLFWGGAAGAQSQAPDVQQIADTMVRLCLAGGSTQATVGSVTGGADLSLRSLDARGNVTGRYEISKSSAEGLVNGIANELTQVAADQADKVRDCLRPVRERLLDIMVPPKPETKARPHDETLPGFAAGLLVQTNDNVEVRRKYQFDFGTPEGAKVAFYLSASNRYAFSVTDIHGEPYTLDIPLGSNGIPFGTFMYVLVEVGAASSYSYLRALVNGEEVAWREFDFPLDLGSRRWMMTTGADSSGKNGGSFSFREMGIYSTTLSDSQSMAVAKNALQGYGPSAPYGLSDGHSHYTAEPSK